MVPIPMQVPNPMQMLANQKLLKIIYKILFGINDKEKQKDVENRVLRCVQHQLRQSLLRKEVQHLKWLQQ